ncbi:MAG TPA: acyltransferase [Acidimicrobiales bacterium]|nr:acyltransferase [Acidimicrobiales bacterium]
MNTQTSSTRWFGGLDGLRALAATLIVVHHAGFSSGLTFRNEFLGQFFSRMDIGVSIFFVLSGFLLYRPFVEKQFAEKPSDKTKYFWIKRLVRIYPAYWLALIVILWSGAVEVFGANGMTLTFSLTQIYHPTRALSEGISQSWSLATELGFYLVLPLLAVSGRKLARGKSINQQASYLLLMCAGLSITSYIFRAVMASLAESDLDWWGATANLWMPSYLDTFSIGMALAVISVWMEKEKKIADFIRPFVRCAWWWWLSAAILFWLVSTQLGLTSQWETGLWYKNFEREVTRQTLYWIIGMFLLIPLIFGDSSFSSGLKFFSSKIMVYLGTISYGIYLWHQGFLTWIHQWFDWPELSGNFLALLAFSLIGSFIVAGLSYWLLEKPLNEKLREILRR